MAPHPNKKNLRNLERWGLWCTSSEEPRQLTQNFNFCYQSNKHFLRPIVRISWLLKVVGNEKLVGSRLMLWFCGAGPSFVPLISSHLVFKINPFRSVLSIQRGSCWVIDKHFTMKGRFHLFLSLSYRIFISRWVYDMCRVFLNGASKMKKSRKFSKMGKQILSIFLYGGCALQCASAWCCFWFGAFFKSKLHFLLDLLMLIG
jgi:hypothetical protein